MDDDAFAVALTSVLWHLDCHLAIEILGGDGLGLQHLLWRALEDYLTSLASCLRTDVNDIVGGKHHVSVVLHDDDRVADVSKLLETVDESLVVSLVQTDTWLVEDVEHIDELTANLCGESDALALASGEGSRLTIEREIVQAHIQEEVDT